MTLIYDIRQTERFLFQKFSIEVVVCVWQCAVRGEHAEACDFYRNKVINFLIVVAATAAHDRIKNDNSFFRLNFDSVRLSEKREATI